MSPKPMATNTSFLDTSIWVESGIARHPSLLVPAAINAPIPAPSAAPTAKPTAPAVAFFQSDGLR